MIRVTCDSCGGDIDRDDSPWYGVDYQPPPATYDDDGELLEGLLTEMSVDHHFHFCKPACLSAWSFDRSLS